MCDLLLTIFNMSVTASVVILFVLLARLLLKRSPKLFSYALWAVVLFRLLCPVSIAAEFSLLGLLDAPAADATEHTTALEYVHQDVIDVPNTKTNVPAVHTPVGKHEDLQQAVPDASLAPTVDPLTVAVIVWLAGMGAMAVYSTAALIRIRRRLMGAVCLRGNIHLADYIDSPFVMGLVRPKIYLPSTLSDSEQEYIILHEQHHIRRGDHVIKTLAFLALCIHWFNPLVWLAFILSGKDMEMSCDEAVVKKLGEGIRRDYSASLLSLATGRRIIAGTPLAFGEGDTKSRIQNMLRWKQAKPAAILLSAVAVILALVVCGTNASTGSWCKIEHEAYTVKLSCKLENPILSYAVYEDIYEDGVLISSTPRITDSFRAEDPREISASLSAPVVYTAGGSGFDGKMPCSWNAAGGSKNWEIVLPKSLYTGRGIITAEHGKQSLEPGDSIELQTILFSTDPDGKLTTMHREKTLMECNDTVVVYRLVTSAESGDVFRALEDSKPSDEPPKQSAGQEVSPPQSAVPETDAPYYLELAAGETFRNMSLTARVGLLVEYEDLLDGYDLIARETEDGKSAYIVGQYRGEPMQSPLYGMYSMEYSIGQEEVSQLLYREADSDAVEKALAEQKNPSVGYRITGSRIYWSSDSGLILIQPQDTALSLDVAWNRYLYTPNGREYIADAVSRGIDVCSRTDTFLYVYRITEQFGELAERIALTEVEAAAILAEQKVTITEGFGFSAALHIDGETTYYNEHSGIPQTVLDLAVERCDYRFGDPSYITDTVREAQLICDWLDEPLYAKAEDLPRLRKILKNAEQGYVGACGYGATLTLTFTGGEKLTVFKGCDGCDTIVFGSYGGYFLGDKENSEFWEIFGLDADTKLPIGYASPEN